MVVFLNGEFLAEEAARVSVLDRGFLYGDGVFETLLVHRGKPFRWAQHLDRLRRGADFLGVRLDYAPKELRNVMGQLVQRNELSEGVLRLTLTRGVGPRGYSARGAESPTLAMTLQTNAVETQDGAGWNLVTVSQRIAANDRVAMFKTISKVAHVLMRGEALEADADEGLLLNTNGEVVEGTRSNLFWAKGDIIWTVPTAIGALPGVTRAVVLELCTGMGLKTNKRIIKPESLRHADGVFMTLSTQGIVPVVSLDGDPVATNPLVDQLRQAYWELVERECEGRNDR